MIEARLDASFGQFVVRLAEKALRLGEAEAQRRTLRDRSDPTRWRRANLVWPLFARG